MATIVNSAFRTVVHYADATYHAVSDAVSQLVQKFYLKNRLLPTTETQFRKEVLAPYDSFWEEVKSSEEDKSISECKTDVEIIAHIKTVCKKFTKIQMTLSNGDKLEVAKIFLDDLERSIGLQKIQKLMINKVIAHQKALPTIDEIYTCTCNNKEKTRDITYLANQNASIDLSSFIQTKFVQIKGNSPILTNQKTLFKIDIDAKGNAVVSCELAGMVEKATTYDGKMIFFSQSMDYTGSVTYDLTQRTIQYTASF